MEKEEIYTNTHTYIYTKQKNKLYIAIAVLKSSIIVAGCAAIVDKFLFHCPFHVFFAFSQDLSWSKSVIWQIGSN